MPVVAIPASTPAEMLLVAGIDTRKLTHHVAVVDHLGRCVADHQFNTTEVGHAELDDFLQAHGHVDRVGVEGTGSYGAGIARALSSAGFVVVEVIRQNRQARRLRGKSESKVAPGDPPLTGTHRLSLPQRRQNRRRPCPQPSPDEPLESRRRGPPQPQTSGAQVRNPEHRDHGDR